ncbi:MAG: hypothetical protein Q8R00_04835 [Candidatus Nanoarchaeia archaeon]|nr:hypothetical protein [Candidatus Nanoarchaeia archaeon]
MNKKGFSAEIFKWILIAVVGGLVLTFFVRFAFQQAGIFEQKGSVQLTQSLEDQLEAFGVSELSSKAISLGYNTEIQFDCERIINLQYPKRTNLLIFGPSKATGNKLLTLTKTWEFPFPVANLYYIAGEKSRFLLVYDKDSLSQVAQFNFPSIFNLQKTNIDNLNLDDLSQNTKSLETLNLVYFTKIPRAAEIFRKFTHLKLNLVEINLDLNEIKIYKQDGSFTQTYFLEDAILYGAIFGPENFECVKEKTIERLNLVAQVHEQKATYLSTKTSSELCKAKYFEIRSTIDSLTTSDSKQSFYDSKERVDSQNKGLRKNACPTIY